MNNIFKRENIKYFSIIFIFIFISVFFLQKSNDFDYSKLLNNTSNLFVEEVTVTDVKGTTSITLVSGKDLIPNSKNATDMKNNTTKLQTAIDTVSNSGGGYVYLPAGTFYFSQGGIAAHGNEDYAIRCRNNVHLIGAGTNENNTSKLTVLKPYYYSPKASGGMDMFYFNNYADTNYNKNGNITPTTKKDVTYTDMNGKTQTLKAQTVYLINADFSNFIVDGDESRGGIAACGGTYLTDGKGFMINLFKDCDWNNVVVKNTDATGFGVDCPLNSTMTNCKAINCGKAATTSDGGASGFGIGVGYSNNESLIITNCVAINNKKFGFFFEHQARFGGSYYPATTSKKFVVSNSIAGGNMYDFGGLKAYDVIFENVKSISGQAYYSNSNFKKTTSVSTSCDSYTKTTYSTSTGITLRNNVQPVFFSLYSTNVQIINSNISTNVTDVTSNTNEINWAINKGILSVSKGKTFSPNEIVKRFDALKTFMIYENYSGQITTLKHNDEINNNKNAINNIGFTDITTAYKDEYDVIVWAYNKGLISKDTKFNPGNDCTRSAYITMLYRLAGSPSVSTTIPFTDVSASSWYYNAVAWGYSVGIVKGSTNNTFLPDKSITKAEIAIFLNRYNNLQTNTHSITYALNEGSVTGNPNTYKPTSSKITLKNPTKSGYTFVGWTGSNGVTPSKNVTIPTGTKGDLAYTANWKPNLSSISVKTTPNKLSYYAGESIISNGLVLNAYYTDSSIEEITGGYSLNPTVFTTAGTQKVTVTYQGKTTSFNVTVTSLQVSSISINTLPNKTTYYVGETLNTKGLVLNVKYSDGATKQVTTGYTISPTNLNSTGTQKITVTYQGKTTSFNVTVKNNSLKSISVKTMPNKTTYYVGDTIDPTGLVLTATYDDNSTKQITSGYTVSPTDLTSSGTQRIVVTYQNKTTTFNITVKSNAIKQISIKKLPNKTTYYAGENLDTTGLILSVSYENGNIKEISNGFSVNKTKLTTSPTETITVTYQNKTTTFNVQVNKVEVNSISIKSLPNQTTYIEKDKFSSEGLTISVYKSNGYVEEITTGFTLSISEGQELSSGTHNVKVTYNGKTTSFDITVNTSKQESLIITKRPNRTNYTVGEKFSSKGLELEYMDKNGNKKTITSGYNLSVKEGTKLSNPGTIKVDITYNNLKTDFTIKVVKAKKIEVDKTTIKTEYKVGEKFDKNNMEIIVTNEDNSKTKVSGKDVEIVGTTDFNSPGEKEIVINYAGSSTKVKVNVTEDNQKDPNNNQNQNNNNDEEATNNEQETEEKPVVEYKPNNTYLIIGGIIVGLCLVLIISLIIKFKNRQKVDY